MFRSYKFKLYPTKSQIRIIDSWLVSLCDLYNCALQERISYYRKYKKSLSKFDQHNSLPELKSLCSEYKEIYAQVLQDPLDRLHKAFQAFFRRLKKSEIPGFPRYRGKRRYNSFCYNQFGFSIENPNKKWSKVKLSKIGNVKFCQDREVVGKMKRCTIKRDNCGTYWVIFACEVPDSAPLEQNDKIIALDLGIKHFYTDQYGNVLENPKHLSKKQKRLAKFQRRLSKVQEELKKDSSPVLLEKKEKARLIVAKCHRKVVNARREFLHKLSHSLIKENGIIVIEDLNLKRMLHSDSSTKSLNRNMNDVALGEFTLMLSYKAESAGRNLTKVDPANTSQMCSSCGNMVEKNLGERWHSCKECGLELDRDHNAAINVLRKALPEEAKRILLGLKSKQNGMIAAPKAQRHSEGMIAHSVPKGKMVGSTLWVETG